MRFAILILSFLSLVTSLVELVAVVLSVRYIVTKLNTILGEIKIMSEKQDQFDAQIKTANESLDKIAEAVTAEAKQVSDFIAANPGVDTSALDGVVTRLGGVADSVSGVFTPPETETETEAEPTPEV